MSPSRSGASETIDVSSSTTYCERGVSSPSLTNLASGDFVVAFGTASGSTVTASKIQLAGAPSHSHHGLAVAGTVQGTPGASSFTITTPGGASDTVDGGSFVIETWNNTQVTVQTSSSTTYTERGVSSASLTDIAVGENVAVFGTVSGSTVTATQIAIGGNGIDGGPGYLGGGRGGRGNHGSGGNGGFGGQRGGGGGFGAGFGY